MDGASSAVFAIPSLPCLVIPFPFSARFFGGPVPFFFFFLHVFLFLGLQILFSIPLAFPFCIPRAPGDGWGTRPREGWHTKHNHLVVGTRAWTGDSTGGCRAGILFTARKKKKCCVVRALLDTIAASVARCCLRADRLPRTAQFFPEFVARDILVFSLTAWPAGGTLDGPR